MSVAKYHVIRNRDGEWRVKRTGANRADSVHPKKDEAIGRARQLAKKQPNGEVIIHGIDGSIRDAHSYGQDRKPSRG
jgi:uncharacterized protein DUF2188